jgi:hypothetical protein
MRFGNSETAGAVSLVTCMREEQMLSVALLSLYLVQLRLKLGLFTIVYEIRSEYSEVFFLAQRSFRSCSSARQSTRVNT